MATKKQKHAASMVKRERYLAAERQVGLDALKKDRERRAYEGRQALAETQRRKDSSSTKFINAMFNREN